MKTLLIASVAAALVCGPALAQTTGSAPRDPAIQSHVKAKPYAKKRARVSADGYYRPGIPKRDAGRYSNLPGKDADYSKAYIQDH